MLGEIIGDNVRQPFEFKNFRDKDFGLFAEGCLAPTTA